MSVDFHDNGLGSFVDFPELANMDEAPVYLGQTTADVEMGPLQDLGMDTANAGDDNNIQMGLYDDPESMEISYEAIVEVEQMAEQLAHDNEPAVRPAPCQVTFFACNIILFMLNLIFTWLDLLKPDQPMPITLNMDWFNILPGCPQCHSIFVGDTDPTRKCPACKIPLFLSQRTSLLQSLLGRPPPDPIPAFLVPIASLSSLLVDFFQIEGNEAAVDEWRELEPSPAGQHSHVMDGKQWKERLDHNGKPFFTKESLKKPNEIRLAGNFSLDWFEVTKSAYSPTHLVYRARIPTRTSVGDTLASQRRRKSMGQVVMKDGVRC
ncbi:uncharacterized protein EV420DRAFT_1730879 [Desarmillaria tabescens]|uniref:Uncharacterized protein n=1 Tax=Armillaria tabescens TaxID=1929756 RepID=A0AA39JF09_ARMTA|nr:uncharacterized protein EV420DRAFT_1730879 [Desarmillaria tabescens]KAK0440877.1 hypothetical protein EV420DRAFT_1730879 [Desarmillaria tabescens]